MDTSFASYQNKWETWRKKNLISGIGIPQDTEFQPEQLKLLIGDLFNFRYACNETIAGFASERFNAEINLLKSTLKKGENDKFTSAEVQIAWDKFVVSLSPTTAHFDKIKNQLSGKDLYDYIQTYTEILPTAVDLQEALADGRASVVASGGGRTYQAIIDGEFIWSDWSLKRLLAISRGFQLHLKVKIAKTGERYKVKSISAKIANAYAVTLDKTELKFEIGEAKINETNLLQDIKLHLRVDSFGNSSTGGGLSKNILGASYSESVSIGEGSYTAKLMFEQSGTTASFIPFGDATISENLPTLRLKAPYQQIRLKKE